VPAPARPLARLALAWSGLGALVPLYQLYALLFVDAGLSQGEVSALFALWSISSVLSEVPTGAFADRWSRRGSVVLASVLQAGGFALWTALPVAPAFAAGFVLWGIGGSLSSGAAEAVIFEGLSAAGGRSVYARLTGWMSATELVVQVPTAVLATLLFSAGGYALVGWVSVASCLATALLAGRFPEPARAEGEPEDDDTGSYVATLRAGVDEALRRPGLAAVVVAAALVLSLDGIEEYFSLMAAGWGVRTPLVPLAVLAVPLAGAAGAALGGRAATLRGGAVLALFVLAGASLGAAAVWARPAALAAVALFYGLYRAVLVVVEARLQDRISGRHRATITSVAGLGSEVATLLVYAAWAVGRTGALAVLALAVVPAVALGLRATAANGRVDPR
jgi:MFS family permease